MALQVGSSSSTLVTLSAPTHEPVAKPLAANDDAKSASTPVNATDSVKLSFSARLHQLKGAGQSAAQIAANLGVDAKTVAAYFSAPSAAKVAALPPPVAETAAPAPAVAAAPVAVHVSAK